MNFQKWQDKEISWGGLARLLLISITILLLGAAIIISIFVRGDWWSIVVAVATSLSVLLAVIQLPLSTEPSGPKNQEFNLFRKQLESQPSAGQGTVVIYTTPKLRGAQVEFLDLQTQEQVALTHVDEHKVSGRPIYAAVINLKPGDYTVQIPSVASASHAIVTVQSAKTVTAVDWRDRYS